MRCLDCYSVKFLKHKILYKESRYIKCIKFNEDSWLNNTGFLRKAAKKQIII
jgi:hypothetical protein